MCCLQTVCLYDRLCSSGPAMVNPCGNTDIVTLVVSDQRFDSGLHSKVFKIYVLIAFMRNIS